MDVSIGVDVGKRRDPTAIAVAELAWRGGTRAGQHDHWVVRHLARLPLGIEYPEIAGEIARVYRAVAARVEPAHEEVVSTAGGVPITRTVPARLARVELYVDRTGVGEAVCDWLAADGIHPLGCLFVAGERRTRNGRSVTLGKAWLVSRLQSLAQSGRLHLPQTSEARAMEDELLNYEIRANEAGHDSFGAFKVGTHDDLVTAVALAVQVVPASVYVY